VLSFPTRLTLCLPQSRSDPSADFLTGIVPDSVSQLVALQSLRLDRNALVGAVPTSISQLRTLHYLYARCVPPQFDQASRGAYHSSLGGNQFETADAATGALVPVQVLQLMRRQRCRISI
jgi:hypothetical protein